MGIEIDYLFAVGLFAAVFAFAVLFTSQNILSQKDDITLAIAEKQADLVMDKMFSGELVSPMYRFYAYTGANSSSDELVVVNLNMFGNNDPYSAIVQDSYGKYHNYSVSMNNIAFAAGSTNLFTVYFDDDSDFPAKDYSLNGTNKIVEKVHGFEKLYVVQYKLIENMKNTNYTLSAIKYHIIVDDGKRLLDYGPEPRGITVIRKRPVMIQNSDGRLTNGWIIVKTWL
ncbi:MAG: hypothetical protein HZB65_02690 [Candidatus Aenigmarchaeota archaeon]|nr:hypothetical protein [Candidatus Aenigmarchaeota archaeon]